MCANWFEAREEGAISVERFFNDVGANRLNADTAGDVGACSVGKCLKAAVKSRCNHRLFYRMLGQDAGDERERTTVSKVVQSVHHKVDLPVQLVIEPCLEVLVCAYLRYTNGAEPKVAIIALNEPAWLKNSFTEATSVMSMPGEELRELDKVRVANDMVVIEGILGDESGERMAQLDEVLQEYLSRMDKPDPIERHAAHMAFHRGVGEASGNTFMMKLWPVLEARMTLVLAVEQEQRHDDAPCTTRWGSVFAAVIATKFMRTYACTWWVVRKNPWKPSTPNLR